MLLDLLFPKICVGCGRLGSYICAPCYRKIQYKEFDICMYCRKRSYLGLTHPACKKKNGVDGVFSFLYYKDVTRKIIVDIKYRMATHIYNEFFRTIHPAALQHCFRYLQVFHPCKLQPMPLHSLKMNSRGFNQSEYIARFLSDTYNIPVCNVLRRIRNTEPQAHMREKRERMNNVRGVFLCEQTLKNENIILVDDVVTTGSTIMEATRILKLKGAKNVAAVTISGR